MYYFAWNNDCLDMCPAGTYHDYYQYSCIQHSKLREVSSSLTQTTINGADGWETYPVESMTMKLICGGLEYYGWSTKLKKSYLIRTFSIPYDHYSVRIQA